MDQKHSMMYPSLSGRVEASSAGRGEDGVPTEAPPSYDVAMAGGSGSGIQQPTAPVSSSSRDIGQYQPSTSSTTVGQGTHEQYSPNVDTISRRVQPVIVDHPVTVGLEPLKLGPNPSTVTCPECGKRRRTRMHHTANRRTHTFALILCLTGWCCGACFVPYCMRSCKTGHHYCGKCNAFLGTYSRVDS